MALQAIPAIEREDLAQKIAERRARIGVVGLGYVGLPLALIFSEELHGVTGFDVDLKKVEALQAGRSYIGRIDEDAIQQAQQRGFAATNGYEAVAEMDAVLICVPTPLTEAREPDLSYITATAEAIAPHLRAGQLIVLESTTYPGTTEEVLVPLLERGNRLGLKVARGEENAPDALYVAFSPEREDPGNQEFDRRDVPKVVAGVNARASELAAALYGVAFRKVVIASSPGVAEMTKLLENIYRCVNIALVNELKLLCLRMGIDVWEVIEAARTKPFGFQAFYPGPGLGGHCIPVDPFYLAWKARQFDFHTQFIELAGQINTDMPYHVVAAVANALNQRRVTLNGARILMLGIAYKKDIDDLRESPSLTIVELLRKAGAEVSYNDPHIPYVGRGRKYDLNLHSTPLENIGLFDCVLIATDHSSYDYRRIVKDARLVVDTRNATRECRAPNVIYC
jgi:UDP-N-acetyl-D-glucosamine dehydrogenase